jgi:hypothetical protein
MLGLREVREVDLSRHNRRFLTRAEIVRLGASLHPGWQRILRPACARINYFRGDARAYLGGTMTCRRWTVLFCALLFLSHGTGAWATPPTLSAVQRQRLEAGEVVVLDALPPGASESAQGGTAVGLVCAPTAVVWGILVDWRNHPAIYPRITRAEVTHADAVRVRVRYTLVIGPFSFDVPMDKYPDPARRRVEWRLAEGQPNRFFAESSGYWQVDDVGAESVVTYAVATRTLVPAFLTRGSHRESLVSTVEAVRTQATKIAPCAHRAR